MADAKQCDRCGRCCPSVKSFKLETNAVSGSYMKTYDLCPACAGEIQRWWYEEKEDAENEKQRN